MYLQGVYLGLNSSPSVVFVLVLIIVLVEVRRWIRWCYRGNIDAKVFGLYGVRNVIAPKGRTSRGVWGHAPPENF